MKDVTLIAEICLCYEYCTDCPLFEPPAVVACCNVQLAHNKKKEQKEPKNGK